MDSPPDYKHNFNAFFPFLHCKKRKNVIYLDMSALLSGKPVKKRRTTSMGFVDFIKRQPSGRIIALGFALVILIGSGLLMLPCSIQEGVTVRYIDALYTSTSAVCVTGLIAIDAGNTFTPLGQFFLGVLLSLPGKEGSIGLWPQGRPGQPHCAAQKCRGPVARLPGHCPGWPENICKRYGKKREFPSDRCR